MLLQNRTQFASHPYFRRGGTATVNQGTNLRSIIGMRNTCMLQIFTAEGFDATSSAPLGFPPGSSIFPAIRGGGMSAGSKYAQSLAGTGSVSSSNLAGGLNGQANISGVGDITTAFGGLILSAIASLSGQGGITASMTGVLEAAASLAGSGDLVGAIGAIAGLLASIEGNGSLSGAPYATGQMAANIRGYGALTPEGIRDSVWSAIIEAGYSAEQLLRILAAHAAGSATGLEGSNPQFTGVDGTTIRIDGNYNAGNRTIDSLNGS